MQNNIRSYFLWVMKTTIFSRPPNVTHYVQKFKHRNSLWLFEIWMCWSTSLTRWRRRRDVSKGGKQWLVRYEYWELRSCQTLVQFSPFAWVDKWIHTGIHWPTAIHTRNCSSTILAPCFLTFEVQNNFFMRVGACAHLINITPRILKVCYLIFY